ncbi:LOW QUALITY PROTEIN: hypothetical protein PHMEG_00023996 [Phytophthora megakarya]|uniref:Uncharacterized protein n=1 Tax=Phytophthora megakarya TaxID=4795 RepID=A0A225VI14_9STRA|nr:LOW QUALITY PROTEIN: hypothetical protein PHMEG_00023996 [Phytophthora megakarya]
MPCNVASAFRNVSIHSNSVYLFAGLIEEENVLLSYVRLLAGQGHLDSTKLSMALSHMFTAVIPIMYIQHWVDDHINVSLDIRASCHEIECSLRYAMVTILGAEAINDDKFTTWGTRQRVLGLEFDSAAETVSIPPSKVEKA